MPDGVRLNKYIADSGLCSRRHADDLIASGRITVNGETAVPGMRVGLCDRVFFGERELVRTEENILLLFHKPAGIVCTAEPREKNNVIAYINYPTRIYPIGRLDKDSTGLLLLTNHGDFFNDIMKAREAHEKEYVVTVNKPLTEDFLSAMAAGVYLSELGTTTRPCRVWKTGTAEFHIILTQGLNRQIRRMCGALGYRVDALQRIRIMNLTLDGIAEGEYRPITDEEKAGLEKQLGKRLW